METVARKPPDDELHLLANWGEPDARARTGKAAIGTIFVHVAILGILLYLPASTFEPRELPLVEQRVTPLIQPPTELTQKAPTKGKITREFDARQEAPTHRTVAPPSPPASAPKPQKSAPAPMPLPPPVRTVVPAVPSPEPPKLEQPKEQPKPQLPAIAQSAPQLPPQIQTQERPRLPLENVPAPAPANTGRGRIPIPSTSVNDVLRDVIRGSAGSGGLIVGDAGALGSGYGGITQPSGNGAAGAAMQLVSDPGGADFVPYLRQILQAIKRNWIAVQPESVRMGRRGKVVVQFSIRKDGVVEKVVFEEHSGADALDRAAVAGISASNPLPPLPTEYKGDRVVLRLNFMYNMPR